MTLIENSIHFIRGRKVILDRDLAKLYGVETKNLNKAVARNKDRFPDDFMFRLNLQEEKQVSMRFQFGTEYDKSGLDKANLKFQNGTSSSQHGGNRKLPYAFTEQGIAMLSSVLRSKQAILVNIQIMRTFTKLREMLASNKELRDKIAELEGKYDQQFKIVFDAIKQLLSPPKEQIKSSSKIGFRTDQESESRNSATPVPK